MNLPRANYPTIAAVYFDPAASRQHGWRCVTDPPPDSPPLGVGDRCQLLSGGTALLVVDVEPFTVAWKQECGVSEHEIERAAVRRVE